MPKRYTVRDEASGRTITFEWEGAEPPTDADLEEIFAEAQGGPAPEPSPADVRSTGDVWRGPVSRFGESAWEMVNPVNVVSGVAQSVAHPIQTVRGMAEESPRLQREAQEAFGEGRYLRGAAKMVASTLPPMFGSVADKAIMQALEGNVAGGLGTVAGFGALVAGPEAVGSARGTALRTAAGTQAGQRFGRWAQRSAEKALVNEMVPKVGANKQRFGGKAAQIAGSVIEEPSIRKVGTFEGLRSAVYDKYARVTKELDDAIDAHPELKRKVWNTPQVIRGLREKLRDYTVETVKEPGMPRPGKDTVPPPWRPKANVVAGAIQTLKRVGGEKGGLIRFDDLRKFRAAYDEWAMEQWWKSIAGDVMKKKGRSTASAQVANVTREWLGEFAPELKPKFKEWSVWRAARDVIDAVDEAERVRPTRRLAVEAGAGMVTGLAMGDPLHGIALSVIGPATDMAFVTGARAAHLRVAGLMHDLAKAIRTGDVARQQTLTTRILEWTKKSAPVSAARPPTVTLVPQAAEERP